MSFLLLSAFALWVLYRRERGGIGTIVTNGEYSWQEIAAAKRNENMDKIPKEWHLSPGVLDEGRKRKKIAGDFIESLLDPETRRITSLDNGEILELVRKGSLTAVQVTMAFCKRGSYAHQLNQNVLEIGFDIALKRAEELDRYYQEQNKTVGPLHGLPVSMKDQWHIKGLGTSMAYVGWINTFEGHRGTGKEKNFESELIRELYSLGAIPIAKTSLVQSLWSGETNNNILGYAWNPHNQGLSAGGSSGGEAAFQALRGSAIGFGSDIGGSVSMPAAFNGIYSFKPSHGRISFKGAANSSPGQMVIPTVVGILGPSIASLRLMFKALLSAEPWLYDPEVLPMPWRSETEHLTGKPPNLSFAVFPSDGVVTPHPPITRAVSIVAKALKAAGYDILPWEPPSHAESATIHPSFTRADGRRDVVENAALSGEPLVPEIQALFANGTPEPIPLPDYYKNTLRLQDFRARYQAYWTSTAEKSATGRPVDAVILPVSPHAAVIRGKSYYYTYASFVNVLDYTNVVIPVTNANRKIDVFDHDYTPLNDKDKKNWLAYDAEKYDGAPASVQILGRRLDEEKLLSVAQVVVEALEKYNAGRKVA